MQEEIHEAHSDLNVYVVRASARQYQNKKSELKGSMLKLVKYRLKMSLWGKN